MQIRTNHLFEINSLFVNENNYKSIDNCMNVFLKALKLDNIILLFNLGEFTEVLETVLKL